MPGPQFSLINQVKISPRSDPALINRLEMIFMAASNINIYIYLVNCAQRDIYIIIEFPLASRYL